MTRHFLLLTAALSAGCNCVARATPEAPDGAVPDASLADAGSPDAGRAQPDSGGPDAGNPNPDGGSDGGAHHIGTVFLIVEENHNWSDIFQNANAPYINNVLLDAGSWATQYYNPPGNHPSEPNYLWLEAGTNFGIGDDGDPCVNHQSTHQHLATLLANGGLSWKAYEEGVADAGCPLNGAYPYAPKHDPFVFFDDVIGPPAGGCTWPNAYSADSACQSHVRPYAELSRDLDGGNVARYIFITPDLCDDGHDVCAPLNDSVAQTDRWLQKNLPTILNSDAYNDGGVIFITWDEAVSGDGPIGLIALSAFAKGHGYSNAVHYTHSSTLRTLQEIFGVTPLLGDASHATDLSDLFQSFP